MRVCETKISKYERETRRRKQLKRKLENNSDEDEENSVLLHECKE